MGRKKLFIILLGILIVGLAIRLSHINYGLPLTYFIDETDRSDPAVRYVLDYKTAFKNKDVNFFRPSSYIKGTFPTYFLTLSLIVINQIASVFGVVFNQFNYVVEMRIVTAFISMLIPVLTGLIYYLLFKDRKGLVLSVFLTSLNWKLVEHSKYINPDTFLTFCLMVSYLFLLLNFNCKDKTKSLLLVCLSGAFFGLAFGAKVTALICLPIFGLLLIIKKNWKGALVFGVFALISYIVTNPFSIIAFNDFISRIFLMQSREGGVVFGSVDLNPLKYLINLNHMLTLPILLISLYGAYKAYKQANSKFFHLFLYSNVVTYVVFFSLASRNSERYLLPTLPIVIIYASYAISYLYNHLRINRYLFIMILILATGYYLYFTISLILQTTHIKPRVEAYYWTKQQVPQGSKILVYTEDGRDPFSSIKGADVIVFSVYVSSGAQYVMPIDPMQYDYVVLSSKPMENFKREYVVKTYPEYSSNWRGFENLVIASDKFSLVKQFKTTNLNLIYFSDISIYKKN